MDTIIQKKTNYRKLLAALGGAALVAGGAVFFQREYSLGNYHVVEADKVITARVVKGNFENIIPVNGVVEPINAVFLDAIRGGIVEEIYVEKGDLVDAGQKLVKFKNTAFQLEIYSQEARVSEQLDINTNTRLSIDDKRLKLETERNDIEYDVKRLKRNLANAQKLFERGHLEKDKLESIIDEFEYKKKALAIIAKEQRKEDSVREEKILQLKESEKRLKDHLQIIRKSLDDLIVKAPISGQVTSLNLEFGESKKEGDRLGKIDKVDEYKIVSEVGSYYVSKLREGKRGSLEHQGKTFAVVVEKVYPEIVNGTFKVDLLFESEKPADLRRGQNFIVKLEISEPTESLMVANGAYYQDTGGEWAFILEPGKRTAEKRPIKLGRRNDRFTEVVSGLRENEEIIISSYRNYIHVDKVMID